MNWTAKDMDVYIQQKDYIDSLLVPLYKIETDPGKMKSSSSSTEFLTNVTTFIETQFKGRIMLMPPFSYTESVDLEEMGSLLSKDLSAMNFKYIFYITTDVNWKSVELPGEVIWLPSLPIENMDRKLKQSVIEDQLIQVMPLLTKKWAEG